MIKCAFAATILSLFFYTAIESGGRDRRTQMAETAAFTYADAATDSGVPNDVGIADIGAADTGVPNDVGIPDATASDATPRDSGGPSVAEAPAMKDSAIYSSMKLWVSAAHTEHLFTTSDPVTTTETHATTDTNTVGTVLTPGPEAHVLTALSAGRSPALGTTGGASRLMFTGAASTDLLIVRASQGTFQSIPTTRAGTIIVQGLEIVSADAAQVFIFDNGSGSSALNKGLALRRTTANKVGFFMANGAINHCSFVTTADLFASTGKVNLVIRLDGAGGGRIQFGANDQSFTCTAVGIAGDASSDLTIGGLASQAGTGSFNFDHLYIFDRALTDGEVTTTIGTSTTRTSNSLVMERSAALGCYNFLNLWLDLTNAATCFEDSGATDACETSDGIRVLRDPRDPTNLWRRAATSTTASPPIYSGSTGGYWDGLCGHTLAFSSTSPWLRASNSTTMARVQNLDNALSTGVSNFLSGNNYAPITGANYSLGTYFLVHGATGGTGSGQCDMTAPWADPAALNWLEIVREGSLWTLTANGQCGSNGAASTAVSSTQWFPTTIGRDDSIVGRCMWGYIEQVRRYQADLSAAQLSDIRAGCPNH